MFRTKNKIGRGECGNMARCTPVFPHCHFDPEDELTLSLSIGPQSFLLKSL